MFITASVINHDVSDRQREPALGTDLIEISKIDANLDLPVLFGHQNNVGHLVWMLLLPDERGIYELIDFGFN